MTLHVMDTDVMPSPGDPLICDCPELPRAYERYSIRSPAEAEADAAAMLSPPRLPVERDTTRFLASGRFAGAAGVTVLNMSYGSETPIRRPGQEQHVGILAPAAGHIEVFHRGQGHIVSAGRSVAALAPGERVPMRWAAGSEVFGLRADTRALQAALKAIAPHADDGPLRFDAPVAGLRSVVAVYGAARLLADVFSLYWSAAHVPHRLTHALAGQALSAVLLSLDSNHSDAIRHPAQPSSSATVNAAVELIDAEICATYSIPDLERHCGVTVRGLELGFRRALDTTPHAFLRRSRLEKAHRDLQAANAADGVTVTEVAARRGFGHAGRFATRYYHVYGITPSRTLRFHARLPAGRAPGRPPWPVAAGCDEEMNRHGIWSRRAYPCRDTAPGGRNQGTAQQPGAAARSRSRAMAS